MERIPEEVQAVKQQALQNLRQKYLQHEAEYIALTAMGKEQDAQYYLDLMGKIELAYNAVRDGMNDANS